MKEIVNLIMKDLVKILLIFATLLGLCKMVEWSLGSFWRTGIILGIVIVACVYKDSSDKKEDKEEEKESE